ncbi:MAG: hypothetical protein FJX00_03830, partial [Alphaproteobacteria bacterium]|nr:hypothetical protein [Alphaproteobacteria bacterium]
MLRLLPQVSIALLDHMNDRINVPDANCKQSKTELEEDILSSIWKVWTFSHQDAVSRDITSTLTRVLGSTDRFKQKFIDYVGVQNRNTNAYIENCEYFFKYRITNDYVDSLLEKYELNSANNSIEDLFKTIEDSIRSNYRIKKYSTDRIETIFEMLEKMNKAVAEGQKNYDKNENTALILQSSSDNDDLEDRLMVSLINCLNNYSNKDSEERGLMVSFFNCLDKYSKNGPEERNL